VELKMSPAQLEQTNKKIDKTSEKKVTGLTHA